MWLCFPCVCVCVCVWCVCVCGVRCVCGVCVCVCVCVWCVIVCVSVCSLSPSIFFSQIVWLFSTTGGEESVAVIVIMEFDFTAFTLCPTIKGFNRCKKKYLILVTEFFHIDIPINIFRRGPGQQINQQLSQGESWFKAIWGFWASLSLRG